VLLVYVSFDSGRTFLLAWWDGLHHIWCQACPCFVFPFYTQYFSVTFVRCDLLSYLSFSYIFSNGHFFKRTSLTVPVALNPRVRRSERLYEVKKLSVNTTRYRGSLTHFSISLIILDLKGQFTLISSVSVPYQSRSVRIREKYVTEPNIWQRYLLALTLTELSGHVTDKCE
jgi:hypothetical protein